MASLKQDLDQYMLMNEEKKSSSYRLPSLNVKMPKIPFVSSSSTSNNNANPNAWLNGKFVTHRYEKHTLTHYLSSPI